MTLYSMNMKPHVCVCPKLGCPISLDCLCFPKCIVCKEHFDLQHIFILYTETIFIMQIEHVNL